MKKSIFYTFSLILLGIGTSTLLSSSSNGRAFAANSGNTGAPGESQTCRSCHGTGFGTTVQIVVKNLNGFPVNEYLPNSTYIVEATVNTSSGSPQRYGFQLVSLLSGNAAYNAWSNPSSNTRIASAGARSYAEHAGKSVSSLFSAQWTAPSSGSGSVTFYMGGAAVNNNGNNLGDGGNTTSLVLPEGQATSIDEYANNWRFSFYPNPVIDQLNIALEGEKQGDVQVVIKDVLGKEVMAAQRLVLGNSVETFDLSGLDNGIYFLQIFNEGRNISSKTIVIR